MYYYVNILTNHFYFYRFINTYNFKQDLCKAIDNHENELSGVITLGEALDQVRFQKESVLIVSTVEANFQ